jgi:hypothetical protein
MKTFFNKGGLYVEGQIFHEPAQWEAVKAFQENDPRAGRKI